MYNFLSPLEGGWGSVVQLRCDPGVGHALSVGSMITRGRPTALKRVLGDCRHCATSMRGVVEKRFPREITALQSMFEFTGDFFAQHTIGPSDAFTINFVVEELFTNMVKYNARNGREISVGLELGAAGLVVRITDFDVEPYDITQTPPVDTTLSLAERRVGGLGIHLVKTMVDSVTYEYVDRESRITVVKSLEKHDV
jgi:serine/threonine-protein kinase RsbW